MVAMFLLAGAGCGVLWHAWWAPPPTGVVVDGTVYFRPDAEFAGTGQYLVVAGVAGLLLGLVVTYLLERDELVTLAACLLGAVAAGLLMAWVGHLLGPESAEAVAARTADFEEIPGDLHAGPASAYLAFPAGTLLGAVIVLLSVTRHSEPAHDR